MSDTRPLIPINPQMLERLCLYLHACGIPIATARITAAQLLRDAAVDVPTNPVEQMDRAMAKVQQWRDTWLNHVDPQRYPDALPQHGEAQMSLIYWHMRRVLESVHDIEGLPTPDEQQCRAVLAECWPVTPACRPTAMPKQSFGSLPCTLRKGFWKVKWQQLRNRADRVQCLFGKQRTQ
jgi:hypothetical protein